MKYMRTKTLIIIVTAIIIVAGGLYYISKMLYTAPVNQNNNSIAEDSVNIQNFSFNPATLTVTAGTTVIWTNKDSAPHTIRSEKFTSGNIGQGQTYQYTFQNVGTYNYICGIHPSMKGTIIVQ